MKPAILKIISRRSFTDRADVFEFIAELHEHGMAFHFDDEIKDIPTFTAMLDDNQVADFQANIDRMWETCERLCLCPFSIHNRLHFANDPSSEYYNKKPIPYTTDTLRMSEFYFVWLTLTFGHHTDHDDALIDLRATNLAPQSAEELLAFEDAYDRACSEVWGV